LKPKIYLTNRRWEFGNDQFSSTSKWNEYKFSLTFAAVTLDYFSQSSTTPLIKPRNSPQSENFEQEPISSNDRNFGQRYEKQKLLGPAAYLEKLDSHRACFNFLR
jgi:hypothetical protein